MSGDRDMTKALMVAGVAIALLGVYYQQNSKAAPAAATLSEPANYGSGTGSLGGNYHMAALPPLMPQKPVLLGRPLGGAKSPGLPASIPNPLAKVA